MKNSVLNHGFKLQPTAMTDRIEEAIALIEDGRADYAHVPHAYMRFLAAGKQLKNAVQTGIDGVFEDKLYGSNEHDI